MSDGKSYYESREDEIDLRELAKVIWKSKALILASTVIGGVAMACYAYCIALPVYQSSALLVPVQGGGSDQLSSAAALFGGKKSGSSDAELYQGLLTSRTVMHKLLLSPMKDLSDTGKGRIVPLYKIFGLDTNNALGMWSISNGLASSIEVGTKESGAGGILEVKISFQYPWLAQQIANSVLEIGQEELRQVRSAKYEVTLTRLGSAVQEAKSEWDSTARKLTWFKDRNRSIMLPEQMLLLAQLEMEKQAKEQKYLLVRKEYEIQQLERAKAAPPMMVLDPAYLPPKKTKPKESLLIFIGIFLGFVGSCGIVLARNAIMGPQTRA